MRFFDSVTASDIPLDAPGVLGYVDGIYAWDEDDWARFPNAVKLRIAVFASTDDGDILDVETGDATPVQAPRWVAMRRSAGLRRPVIYCNRATWQAVLEEMGADDQHADYLIADWTGQPHTIPGTVGVQYADPATSGGHYDLSEFEDSWINPPVAKGRVVNFSTPIHVGAVDVKGYIVPPTGTGTYVIGVNGSVYAWGPPDIDAPNRHDYWKLPNGQPRTVARVEALGNGFTVYGIPDGKYDYPGPPS